MKGTSSVLQSLRELLMQVWVYEEADEETEDNLYVHHDVIVPYFPLSVAWLDMDPTGERPRASRARHLHPRV